MIFQPVERVVDTPRGILLALRCGHVLRASRQRRDLLGAKTCHCWPCDAREDGYSDYLGWGLSGIREAESAKWREVLETYLAEQEG